MNGNEVQAVKEHFTTVIKSFRQDAFDPLVKKVDNILEEQIKHGESLAAGRVDIENNKSAIKSNTGRIWAVLITILTVAGGLIVALLTGAI